MPKTVPAIYVGHKYQPPLVIVPNKTQLGLIVTSASLPTVTITYNPIKTSSLAMIRIDLM